MTNISQAPSADLWTEVRANERTIYDRAHQLTPVNYPGFEAVEVWDSGLGSFGGDHDTFAYNALPPALLWGSRRVILAGFNFADIGESGYVNFFELSLKPGSEQLLTYAAHLEIGQSGIPLSNLKQFWKVRKDHKQHGLLQPDPVDLQTVRQQLARGALDIFTIRHPNDGY